MKKILGVIGTFVFLVVATVIGRVIGQAAVESSQPAPNVEATLQQVATQINAQLPRMLDQETRMDEARSGPGKTLTYFYTLTSYDSREVDHQSALSAIEPGVRRRECNSSKMRVLFTSGVTAQFVYRGNDGGEITSFAISPADCGIVP